MEKIFSVCLRCGITANRVTLAGLFFVVFGIYAFAVNYKIIGFSAIVFGLALDVFDGALARSTETVSKLGKILDRFSDKIKFNILVFVAIFVGGYHIHESLILSGLPIAILLFAFMNCTIELWGILLIAYQWFFEPKSKGNGAVIVGKVKFFAQSVFGATLFYPDIYFIAKPFVLFVSGLVGAVLAVFSFSYHVKHVRWYIFFPLTLPFIALFSYIAYIFFIK